MVIVLLFCRHYTLVKQFCLSFQQCEVWLLLFFGFFPVTNEINQTNQTTELNLSLRKINTVLSLMQVLADVE